jgi:hypothetical protein
LAPWKGALPLDFWVPEAFVFLVLYNLPHLALAQSLLLWSVLWTLDGFEDKQWPALLKAGAAAMGMTLVVPFYAGVLAAALGAFLLALAIRERRAPWRRVGQTMVVGAFAAPVVAYNLWAFTTNPALRVWTAQNTILSPHALHYVLGYLPLLIPAVPGAVLVLRQRDEKWLLPLAWVLIVPVLLYSPFNLQRRMIAVAQVPLAMLAAQGLVEWLKPRTRAWRTIAVAWAALASLSNLVLVSSSLTELTHRAPPAFHPAGEIAAMDWLAGRAGDDDIVLSAYESGNVIPARAHVRVFLGHGPETLYTEEKREAVRRFFDAATGDAWRQELIDQYSIDWVFYGPAEQVLGTWDPTEAPYLEPVYDNMGHTLFRVIEAVGSAGGES